MALSSCCGVQSGAVASDAPVAGLTTPNVASVLAATPSIVIVTSSLTGPPVRCCSSCARHLLLSVACDGCTAPGGTGCSAAVAHRRAAVPCAPADPEPTVSGCFALRAGVGLSNRGGEAVRHHDVGGAEVGERA